MEQAKAIRNLKLVGVGFLLLIIGLAAWYVYSNNHFVIESTDPASNNMTIWNPVFKINFNKNLSRKGLSVSTSPQIVYNNQIVVTGKTLAVYISVPLNSNQTYTITINNVEDTAGKSIQNKSFSFKPAIINKSQLSDDDQEILINRNTSSSVYNNPILSHLPYSTLDFVLTSSFPVGANNLPHLVLQAQLQLAPGVTGAEATTTIAQYKQEVVSYIRSLGLDPSKYTINYTVLHESLTGV